jgi:hypothetical protein
MTQPLQRKMTASVDEKVEKFAPLTIAKGLIVSRQQQGARQVMTAYR